MTERQKKLILKICEALDYDFTELRNMTTEEASEFIEENRYEYYEVLKERKLNNE